MHLAEEKGKLGEGAEITELYRDAIVIDALNVSNWESRSVFRSLHAGGLTAINATTAIWENFRETMDNTAGWLKRFEEYEDTLLQVKTLDDIMRAKREGRVGVILGWQNATPIENKLDRLRLFYELGVRIIQITYNERNLLGNGCYERADGGLSHFGADAVREMNRLGILIDLSHVGDRTTIDAAEVSDKPVACTHANARAFFGHVRNKHDDALKLIAERGGVVGANAFPPMLRGGFQSTLDHYIEAIDDLVERVGVDHVGIGTDYTQDQPKAFFDWLFSRQGVRVLDRPTPYPDPVIHPCGMETPDKFCNIAEALRRRGYSPEDVMRIIGGNWLRLFREVWAE